ncbi:hypothetical protein BKA61DRAFT_620707 [Leptodontidium sp. MPI-SDFR-AT-0119]|nr:hypothetical protein BKA61DRAFT_620707 [Leptodontidium sp. MPI-SDFR-AT-0119]
MARLLLESGADVDSKTSGWLTPLHYAALKRTNPEMIRLLIEANAKVDTKTNSACTPLSFASGSTDWTTDEYEIKYRDETREESAKLLLAAGARFSCLDWQCLHTQYKEMFANYCPAGQWSETSDKAVVPWSAESDENYADIVRHASRRDTGHSPVQLD